MDLAQGQLRNLKAKRGSLKLGRPTRKDATASVLGVIVNTPDVMADGFLARINPAFGIYTLMVTTPIAALFSSTRLMVVVPTSAITLTAAGAVGDQRQGDDRIAAFMMVTLIAGVFQLLLGTLKMGFLTHYISTAVMTGFLNGVLVLVILGQLGVMTGYEQEGSNSIRRTADLIRHLDEIDGKTTVVGVTTLVLLILLSKTRLSHIGMLAALAIVTAFVQFSGWDDSVELIEDVSPIPSSLPSIHLPDLGLLPDMLFGGIAVGIIGLVLGAGVSQRFPNPGGPRSDDSQDFFAQGIGNIGGSFVRALPGTGSLSATAVNVSSGATTRWANILQGFVMLAGVLIFSDLLNLFPEAALGALLIYSSAIAIDLKGMRTVWQTGWMSEAELAVTFLLALLVPLPQAIFVGIVIAFLFFVAHSGSNIRLTQIVRRNDDLVEQDPPAQLESDAITIMNVDGSLFFAGAKSLLDRLPKIGDAKRPVVILRLAGETDASTTFFAVIEDYAEELEAAGGKLILSDVDAEVLETMNDAGYVARLGEEYVLTAEPVIGASTKAAFAVAQAWQSQTRMTDEQQSSQPKFGEPVENTDERLN